MWGLLVFPIITCPLSKMLIELRHGGRCGCAAGGDVVSVHSQKPTSPRRPAPHQRHQIPGVFRTDDYFASQPKQWHTGGFFLFCFFLEKRKNTRSWPQTPVICRDWFTAFHQRTVAPWPQRSNNSLSEQLAGSQRIDMCSISSVSPGSTEHCSTCSSG